MSPSSGYQEIFAEFVESVIESKAQWYSIKTLQNDITSLADLLDLLAETVQRLLVKFGLVKVSAESKTLSFQASKFKSFRSTFTIQELCETTQCKVKGTTTKHWFVRLGIEFIEDLADPDSKGRAPQVQNI